MAKTNQDHIPAFGRLLRFWRMTTELSQEELSARVGASARHLSFLENGKSNPGRQMVIDLAQVFDLAHRDTNNMLVAAGFQPNNTTDDSETEQKFLDKSLKLTLHSLNPAPACIADPCGDIRYVNRAWVYYHQLRNTSFVNGDCTNSYHLYFSNEGLRPYLEDWDGVACALLMNLQQEVLLTDDAKAQKVLVELLNYPDIPENWRQRGKEVAYNHSFRVKLSFDDGPHQTYIAINNTVGATPYVSEPRLLISSLHSVNPNLYDPDLTGPLSHPLLVE